MVTRVKVIKSHSSLVENMKVIAFSHWEQQSGYSIMSQGEVNPIQNFLTRLVQLLLHPGISVQVKCSWFGEKSTQGSFPKSRKKNFWLFCNQHRNGSLPPFGTFPVALHAIPVLDGSGISRRLYP